MSELSGKTVAELRELAREREVASRTEINRARKATLLEWLEAPNTETPEESPANVEEDQQVQGELFPTPSEVETVQPSSNQSTVPTPALIIGSIAKIIPAFKRGDFPPG